MDKLEKALQKLSEKERTILKQLLTRLHEGTTRGLDITKLKGYSDIFRLRKGRIRVIFRMTGGSIFLLKIDRRSDTTYRDF